MSLISQNTINVATGTLDALFQQNSRLISINKNPIQVINTGISIPNSQNGMYGYGTPSFSSQEITYQSVSGVYPAVILYNYRHPKYGNDTVSNDIHTKLVQGASYIKVRQNANDFILNGGKVISILVDNKLFNLGTSRQVAYHWGLYFFYYEIVETN